MTQTVNYRKVLLALETAVQHFDQDEGMSMTDLRLYRRLVSLRADVKRRIGQLREVDMQ